MTPKEEASFERIKHIINNSIYGMYDAYDKNTTITDSHCYPLEKPPIESDGWSKEVLVVLKDTCNVVRAQLHYASKENVEYWYSLELGRHIDAEDVTHWFDLEVSNEKTV